MPPSGESPPQLDEQDRARLLEIARQAITTAVAEGRVLQMANPGGRLAAPAGVFVSLHKRHLLRGCIGQVAARDPLYRAVIDAATSAALYDPRFPPLSKDELAEVDIEISVLSPFTELDPALAEKQIRIGRHGLMVTKGHHRGLLLPQVAVQFGWDTQKFLEETCLKAGLPPETWTAGACLETFTAEVFSEKKTEKAYSNST